MEYLYASYRYRSLLLNAQGIERPRVQERRDPKNVRGKKRGTAPATLLRQGRCHGQRQPSRHGSRCHTDTTQSPRMDVSNQLRTFANLTSVCSPSSSFFGLLDMFSFFFFDIRARNYLLPCFCNPSPTTRAPTPSRRRRTASRRVCGSTGYTCARRNGICLVDRAARPIRAARLVDGAGRPRAVSLLLSVRTIGWCPREPVVLAPE